MKQKISQTEQEGFIDKNFLIKYEYITKSALQDILNKQRYVTESYLKKENKGSIKEILKHYEKDMRQHIEALMEYNKHYFHAIIETLEGRFERNEENLENLDNRVSKLEVRPSF